jgi:N-glycosylase/DNA lyase
MSDPKQKEITELNKYDIDQLKKIYSFKKKEINSRLKEFEKIWSDRNDEGVFVELVFCLLTPQSRARLCWDTIVKLKEQDLLLKGDVEQIKQTLNCVRFKNKKAEYIVAARKIFTNDGRVSIKTLLNSFADVYTCREWLVKNIKGIGYKEASHFLRNIGLGKDIAILDRHILRNLNLLGVIEEIPESISRLKYMQIEQNMREFARQIDIPLSHLDLLLWYKETGEIFK